MHQLVKKRQNSLLQLLGFNIALFLFLLLSVYGIKFLKSSILEYADIKSDSFNGTIYPISYVPNWLKSKNTNKSLSFDSEALDIDEFIEIPKYNVELLQDSSGINKDAILARYTYPVVYMGNYKLDYEEYAGSHPGIDIRAPIGTPVLSIANGVVVKVKNTETGDGKYVIIRHDNIKNGDKEEVYYSSYLHLSEIFAEEGTKISKGDVLGKVGMTGITTTPHLHFQIDKKNAPFNPYWPFTFKEASDIGLDFFGAINFGLGKENAMANTVNPLEFINSNLEKLTLDSAPEYDNNKGVVIDNVTTTKNDNPTITDNPKKQENDSSLSDNSINVNNQIVTSNTGNIIEKTTEKVENTIISNGQQEGIVFKDIPKQSDLYKTTKFLFDKKITSGYSDGTFKAKNTLTRKEAIIFIFKLYNINLDSKTRINFADVEDDFMKPYLSKAVDLGYISSNNKFFRPNDIISRAEFITILIKASGVPITNIGNTGFDDIKSTDWYAPYIETFVYTIGGSIDTNRKFQPNSTFNRGQIAQILYTIASR